MDTDLREQLREAADLPVDPGVPPGVARAARRRRGRNGVLAGVLGVVLVAGAIAGTRGALSLIDGAGAAPHRPAGPPTAPAWSGQWPDQTRAAAEAAQALADSGAPEGAWQLDVEQVVSAYGVQVLGWEALYFDDSLDIADPDESGPLTLHVSDCDSAGGLSACSGARQADVTVERLLRRDRSGVWEVTGAALEPGTTPLTGEGPARTFVESFLKTRYTGSGAEAYLSAVAQKQFAGGENGLSLYGPSSTMRYGALRLVSLTRSTLDPNVWEARVEIDQLGGATVETVAESLEVGPDDQGNLVVISAARVAGPVPSPTDAAAQFVAKFMDARIRGSDAERSLSPGAKAQYDGHGAGLWLYGSPTGDPSFTYDAFTVESIHSSGVTPGFEAVVLIHATSASGGSPATLVETLEIGPGADLTGREFDLVVLGASRGG